MHKLCNNKIINEKEFEQGVGATNAQNRVRMKW